MTREELLAAVAGLHGDVDARATEIAALLAGRLRCGPGCADCCLDGLTVFRVEAELIIARHRGLLRGGRPHLAGRCAFLGADLTCRVYAERPYVCRTQGLPLRWLEEEGRGQMVELRDICPRNQAGPPIEALPEAQLWEIGPSEGRLAELQREAYGSLERVALRSLFAVPPEPTRPAGRRGSSITGKSRAEG